MPRSTALPLACTALPLLILGSAAVARAADCAPADGGELTACLAQLQAGDTVTLGAGTFEVSGVTIAGLHGTDAAPIVIRGTLDGDGSRLSHVIGQSTGANTIEIRSSSYLELRDFELSHAAGASGNSVDLIKFAGTGEASHHIIIDNLDVHDCGNVAISSQADEIHDVSVTGSYVHDIGGSCFYWGYYENEEPQHQVHHCLIAGNLLQRCPQSSASDTHYGIQLKSGNHDNRIEDNVLVDVAGTTRVGIAVYHSAPKPVGSPLLGSNLIRGNLVLRSRNEGINASAGAVIENNLVVDAAGIGIFLQPRSYGGVTYFGSLQVRNNTVVQSGGGEGIRFASDAWANDDPARPTTLLGNLSLVAAGAGLRPPAGAATVDLNATNGNANGAAGTIALSSPGEAVVSWTFGEADFAWPLGGGPLVDAGVPGAAPIDFNHVTRDGAPDVGAYEWTGPSNPGWPPAEDEPKPTESSSGGSGGAGTGGAGGGGGGAGTAATGGSAGGHGDPAAAGAGGDEGGCGCRTGAGLPLSAGWWLLPLAALCRRRRGRRARS